MSYYLIGPNKHYYLVMSSAASRILKQVKPHLPRIKFRKEYLIRQAMPVLPETVVAPVVATPATPKGAPTKEPAAP